MQSRASFFVVNTLQLVPTLLIGAEVRKPRLATVPALLPVFKAPGTKPAEEDTSSKTSSPSTAESLPPMSSAEPTKTGQRITAQVLEIDTAQLRAAKIWAHNIARKLLQKEFTR